MISIKQFSFIVLIILIVFSVSAVSATNETVANDSVDTNVSLENVTADNSTEEPVTADSGDSNNTAFGGIIDELPKLEVAFESDDESSDNPYIDISLDYQDYSLNINNKNYFFTFNQDFKNNSLANPNGNKLLNLAAFSKKNGLFLNVNFLNVSNNDIELYNPTNIFAYVWDLIWSFLNSLF